MNTNPVQAQTATANFYGISQILSNLIRKRDEAFSQMTPREVEIIKRAKFTSEQISEMGAKTRALIGS